MKKRFQKLKDKLLKRWSEEDYPDGSPRFQIQLLAKDVGVFIAIPIFAVVSLKVVEASMNPTTKPEERRRSDQKNDPLEVRSQIVHFQPVGGGKSGLAFSKRAPGTLVRVRLMNVVETIANASVHAQIIDRNLGKEFLGATMVGDASSDSASGRVKMTFKFVRHPQRTGVAAGISARALSLDGTYGVLGTKKEGLFARAAFRSGASGGNSSTESASNEGGLKEMIARSIASSLMQEFQADAGIARNNAQVLTLKPMTEFFVELTDYFPEQK